MAHRLPGSCPGLGSRVPGAEASRVPGPGSRGLSGPGSREPWTRVPGADFDRLPGPGCQVTASQPSESELQLDSRMKKVFFRFRC